MRNPNGFRAESSRTPKASRAGALYATQRYSTPAKISGAARIHVQSVTRAVIGLLAAWFRQTDGLASSAVSR